MVDSLEQAPVLVRVLRDGAVESVHRALVAVADPEGALIAGIGDARGLVYPRSALKPFQAAAVLEALEPRSGLDPVATAIAASSHQGTVEQQIEAARLLALAGLDEAALACPEDTPVEPDGLPPAALSHNCSGKHAAFLLAQVQMGEDPAAYLEPGSAIQRLVARHIAEACGAEPSRPAVDGCGAPAWSVPLSALATGFARLADGREPLGRVAEAMRARPDLVGGPSAPDTALMRADPRLVAKRGAEGVLAAGLRGPGGPVGVAVKVADGAIRGAVPLLAGVLRALGAAVPDRLAEPSVLGGGEPHGAVVVDDRLVEQLNLPG
jgi:L-asparaginase II